ncbi:MAG: hypothetical protein ACE5FT_02375 [Candidatus Nanoarchaeia archaeon]
MALLRKGRISLLSIGIIPSIIFLFMMYAIVSLLVNSFVLTEVDTLGVDAALLTERVLHSTEGISYVDPVTQRVYPHILDAEKLEKGISTQKVDPLDSSLREHSFYGLDNQVYAAKFSVLGEDYYFNKDRFERWRPMASRPVVGGRIKSFSAYRMLVFVRKDGKLIPGTLNVEVVAQP